MKRNKKVKTESLSEIAIQHNIRISKPYGYYPEDVDNIIRKYSDLVSNLEKETARLESELVKTKEEFKVVDDELRKTKFEMSVMEVPDTSAETDLAMLGRINSINESAGTIEPEIPEEKSEPRIPLDIVENSSNSDDIISVNDNDGEDDLVFDSLISLQVKDSKQSGNSEDKNNISSIYNENGELEIL